MSPVDVDVAAAAVEGLDMDQLVTLTPAARTKLAELVREEPGLGLRVYVTAGGCSGFRYGMLLEDAPRSDDTRSELDGLTLYVDPASAPLVTGSTIDYVDALMGAGFVVENPNAVAGCACGSSFQTADASGTPRSCGR